MQKILVTGGAGFIGSHIVDLLTENDFEVIVVDNLSSGKKTNLSGKAKHYLLDITSPEMKDVIAKEKPAYICHHAAQISVSYSVRQPRADAKSNILGILNILESASENGVEGIIFASSGGAVYGEPKQFPITEKFNLCPSSPYGIAKMASEYYLQFFKEYHNLNYISLRYGNVYGPRQDPFGEAGVIAIFINEMLKGDTPTINGDGEYIRDYIYVEDVANACLLSIKNMLKLSRLAEQEKGIHFTSFNLGTGQATSVNQLFCYLKKIINFDREASYGPSRPGDLRKNILNNQLAKKHLAWHPKYTIQEGLKKTVDWFKSMKNI